MRFSRTWCAIVGLAAVAGCSRQETLPCEPEARYSSARSAQPVQIPDDLSPPNEGDALRLPADPSAAASITAGDCLEEPPSFFGESRPFTVEEEKSRREARRERREAEREERTEAPAAQPEAAAPAEPSEPAPAGDDRVIDN